MSHIPSDLYYTETHEWLRSEEDGTITMGITDHAQALLGDMVYVELPELEEEYDAGHEVAVVESVKSAADVYCPIAGEIIAVNNDLEASPGLINTDPYGDGWLIRLRPNDSEDLAELLDADSYEEKVNEEAH